MIEDVDFGWLPPSMVDEGLLGECSALYSNHYGKWSASAPHHAEQPIKLSPARIQDWLKSPHSRIATARVEGNLVGYAIAIRLKVPDWGVVSWVTQLVVHEEYRNAGVAKRLMFAIWRFSNHHAWGLVSANPYAVRALEKATRRRCSPSRIRRNRKKLHRIGYENTPYIDEARPPVVDDARSIIDSQFFVDHSELASMLEAVQVTGVDWALGDLPEGWEWFAFTFHDQDQLHLTTEEVQAMLKASDSVVRSAYERMAMDEGHAWAKWTGPEVDYLQGVFAQFGEVETVLDFGCGTGRHVIELGDRGYDAKGIDYVGKFITRARAEAAKRAIPVTFEVGDCRTFDGPVVDAVLCLYDIIGTYADDAENRRILENARDHVRPGGGVVLSVMNLELTLHRAKHFFSLKDEPERLLQLEASDRMETTGNIFDPNHYMVETDSQVIYRREQFDQGELLPDEMIVRDRRYSSDGIRALCEDVGLEVLDIRYVRAGSWADPADRLEGKEILVVARRPEA